MESEIFQLAQIHGKAKTPISHYLLHSPRCQPSFSRRTKREVGSRKYSQCLHFIDLWTLPLASTWQQRSKESLSFACAWQKVPFFGYSAEVDKLPSIFIISLSALSHYCPLNLLFCISKSQVWLIAQPEVIMKCPTHILAHPLFKTMRIAEGFWGGKRIAKETKTLLLSNQRVGSETTWYETGWVQRWAQRFICHYCEGWDSEDRAAVTEDRQPNTNHLTLRMRPARES